MDKYSHYYLNDFNDRYEAFSEVDADGEWYRVSDVEDMTTRLLADKNARIAELEKEVEQLQLALAFWLPNVPSEGDVYIINRIGDHAMLLCGLNAEPEQSAQDRGWITLDASE